MQNLDVHLSLYCPKSSALICIPYAVLDSSAVPTHGVILVCKVCSAYESAAPILPSVLFANN
jgi:hypothetical protein